MASREDRIDSGLMMLFYKKQQIIAKKLVKSFVNLKLISIFALPL